MNISIQTTADRMIVHDIDKGIVLDWVDVVTIEYAATERRSVLYLGTYEDSTVKVVSAPPPPTPAPVPAK
jgi:hypothetical protein